MKAFCDRSVDCVDILRLNKSIFDTNKVVASKFLAVNLGLCVCNFAVFAQISQTSAVGEKKLFRLQNKFLTIRRKQFHNADCV
ncbi:hypothetical protein BpHYR1_033679 [Brachionus plicatilis]|uniref:Uncharacterized protein n=1 Tax=Brachionus plicatilis TaxID=10195 RepID=A0A3M7Q8W2_BRAPC|nr:hypothetical protein BpHYR1_033679 [Brachionus plicatilis]